MVVLDIATAYLVARLVLDILMSDLFCKFVANDALILGKYMYDGGASLWHSFR